MFQIVSISLILMIILLRYVRTPIFESYIVFMHPYILLITGYIIFSLVKRKFIFGFVFLILIIISSIVKNFDEITHATNVTSIESNYRKKLITKNYPGKKFAIYDFSYKSTNISLPLVLFLYTDGKIDNNGYKIGIGELSQVYKNSYKLVKGNSNVNNIWDINDKSFSILDKDKWSFVNPSMIYTSTEEWYLLKRQ